MASHCPRGPRVLVGTGSLPGSAASCRDAREACRPGACTPSEEGSCCLTGAGCRHMGMWTRHCQISSFFEKSQSSRFLCKTSRFLTGIKRNSRKPFFHPWACCLGTPRWSWSLALMHLYRPHADSCAARNEGDRDRGGAENIPGSSTLLGRNLLPPAVPTRRRSLP